MDSKSQLDYIASFVYTCKLTITVWGLTHFVSFVIFNTETVHFLLHSSTLQIGSNNNHLLMNGYATQFRGLNTLFPTGSPTHTQYFLPAPHAQGCPLYTWNYVKSKMCSLWSQPVWLHVWMWIVFNCVKRVVATYHHSLKEHTLCFLQKFPNRNILCPPTLFAHVCQLYT